MKFKLIIITAITSFSFCFADESYYDDVYYFPGVSSEYTYNKTTYKVEQTSLSTQIQHIDKLYTNGKPKVLMGHSAGGLKAMAYASLLNQKGKKNEVKGIITMGAPLKGFSALAQGRNVLNKKIENKINTLTNAADAVVDTGINAIDAALSLVAPLTHLIPAASLHYYPGRFTLQGYTIKAQLKYLFGPLLGHYIFQQPIDAIINLGILGDSFVNDISTNSVFLNNYINPKTTVKTSGYYKTVKVYQGWGYYEPIWKTKRNCFGWKYSYISGWKWVNVYKTKQVWVDPTYNYYPRIDKNIPITMIVGQENDPLTALDDDTRKLVKTGIEHTRIALIAAEAWHCVKASFAYSSIFLAPLGVQYTIKAVNCSDARKILENYKREYGLLLGSTANDCFITEDSQQYPLNRLGGIPIAPSNYRNGVATCSSNHFKEPSHEEIWGKGGGASYDKSSSDESKRQRLKYGSIRGGILKICFDAMGLPIDEKENKGTSK
ncbi:MAG: hypothetical protein J1G30_00920 [Spirochaetales bacterium]|nr:hypothetical protein [Spirochaetales bacterium]